MSWRETWDTVREILAGTHGQEARIARLTADLEVTTEERDDLDAEVQQLRDRLNLANADLERERAARRIVDKALEQALQVKREEQ